MPTKYGVPVSLAKGDTREKGCNHVIRVGVADHVAHLNCCVPTTYGVLYSHPGAPTWPPNMWSLGPGVREIKVHIGARFPQNGPSVRVWPNSMYLHCCVPSNYGPIYNHRGGPTCPPHMGSLVPWPREVQGNKGARVAACMS